MTIDSHDSQSSEPSTADRWELLSQAFAAHGFPLENLPLVQRLVDSIGIDHYEGIASRTYIKGVRRDGGRTVEIHFGYTGGLVSEAEIVDAVGDVSRESSSGDRWWLHHPINKIRDGGEAASRTVSRDFGTCPECFIERSPSGACGCPA